MKKKRMARAAAVLLVMLACMAAGCSQQGGQNRPGTSDNEVLTLTEVPEDKLMITMRMMDGMNFEAMERAIESEFPNVDIVMRSNTAMAQSMPSRDTEDIVLMIDGNFPVADLEANFMDLSAETYVQNYFLSALQHSEVDGKLYSLPGPSNIYGIVYNKDLFRQNGWLPPKNLDEFIALCTEIEKTGIRAIQPALYYKDAVRQFFTGFTYQPVLSGGENAAWLSAFKAGTAVMEGHMEPAFDIMDRLIEAGILRVADFDMQPGTRSNMMYQEQSCAMILETQAAASYAEKRAGEDAPELGLLPFFSGSDDNSDYFLSVPIYNIAASKRLEEPGNEEKLAAVKEIFAYLSTAQGQAAAMGDNVSVISSIKGAVYEGNEFLENAHATIEKGHVVPQPFFVDAANSEVNQVLREDLRQYAAGTIDRMQFMADMNHARDQVMQKQQAVSAVVIGTAEEDFSILETACLLGEIFRERTDAQIGLCTANTRESGNNWKISQGDILYGRDDTLDYYFNLSFKQIKDQNGIEGKLIKVSMTGENILKALNGPYLQSSSFPNAYLTASGLKITFAPWAGEGKRYTSVLLPDGSELDPDTLYTVAFWNGTVDPALIERVEAEYDDTAVDLFREWVNAHGGTIGPDKADFTLDWETIAQTK